MPVELDQKETLQQLNSRLAHFIQQCRHLEESNHSLQRKIEEQIKRNGTPLPDWKDQEQECNDLLQSISTLVAENANTSKAIEDYSVDLAMLKQRFNHATLEVKQIHQESERLRTIAVELSHGITELTMVIAEKEEEKQEMTLYHQEEVQAMQQLMHPAAAIHFAREEDGSRMELSQLLNEIRGHYEALISQTHIPSDLSARSQMEEDAARQKMRKDEEELRAARANLQEAKKQYKALQGEIVSLQAMERSLKCTLHATEQQHQKQLEALSTVITDLEEELQEVRTKVRSQVQKHQLLLNTNMKLEQEISAYRRLLESEESRLYGTNHNQERKSSANKKYHTLPSGSVEKCTEVFNKATKPQAIFNGNIAEEGAEASGTVQTEKVDELIKKWEGSFFKDNPKLRKKSVSLRFDLHLAAADEVYPPTKNDNVPDVEVRLIMRRSCSIPTMSP